MAAIYKLERARRNFTATTARLCRRRDALGKAAIRGRLTLGNPLASVRSWFRVGPSSIHGHGVFAARRYRPGDPIVMGFGRVVRLRDSAPTYSFTMRGAGQAYHGLALECTDDASTNVVKNFNSGRAGSNAQVFWHGPVPVVYAQRDIAKNEEILLAYRV